MSDEDGVAACALDCLGQALEQVAFTLIEPCDAPFDWDRDDLVWAEIELVAPLAGVLALAATRQAVEALAADAWGRASPGDDSAAAFVAELANIVAGQLLARLYPDRSPRIGLPTVGRGRHRVGSGAVDRDGEPRRTDRDAVPPCSLSVDVGSGLVGLGFAPR